ncbi:MAG: DUF6438 domain-containing protein [Paludibacter sp.]|nr:DUF6438 domain-containing protein [Paludibacter sp.]
MKIKNTILFIVCFLALSCNNANRQDEKLKHLLIGEWELFQCDFSEKGKTDIAPYAISFLQDRIEIFQGWYQFTENYEIKYLGSFVPYKIQSNNIFIKNLSNNNWEFYRKFINLSNDTLTLAVNDSTTETYSRLTYNVDTVPDFDQIIYSSSGCFGTCQIINISVDKNGEVYFQGESYASKIGFFKGKIDNHTQEYIFGKFKKANPINLLNHYSCDYTCQATITTTFIKDGKIVKTIRDYGNAAPKELKWAYVSIFHLQDIIELDSLSENPQLNYDAFRKNKLLSLPLQKSQSFYLWTELAKSNVTEQTFNPIYSLSFSEKNNENNYKAITTDGRFYKFEYNNKSSITYDLGYNFIEHNFEKSVWNE